MKVTIVQRKGNGDVVYTNIEPALPEKNPPKLHYVRIERHENGSNSRTVARFILDSENEVEEFLILVFKGRISGEKILVIWRANNCEELYA